MGKKILIVDDSKTFRQQVTFTLEKGGFQVVEAEDGKQGIDALAANPDIAIVISDVNMPIMDGIQMVEAIMSNPKNAKLPVLMLTNSTKHADGTSDLITRAKQAGAKAWLVKPFKPEQLVSVVTKIVAA